MLSLTLLVRLTNSFSRDLCDLLWSCQNATFHKDRFVVVGEAEHVFSHLSRSGFTLDFATEPALYLMQRSDL